MLDSIRDKSSVWLGALFAVVIALLICYLLGGPSQINSGAKAWNWTKTEATIISAKTVADKQYVNLTVEYKYCVNGMPHNGQALFSGNTYDNIPWLKKFHAKDRKVDCLYNPQAPDQSILEYQYRMFEFFAFISIAIVIIAAATGLVLVVIIKLRNNPLPTGSIFSTVIFYGKIIGWSALAWFGLVCFYYAGIKNFIKAAKEPSRIKCEAQVIRSRMVTKSDKFSLWKELDFAYVYKYHGKQYESSKVSAWDDEEDKKIPAKYPVGKKLPCYIMPDKPENAVIEHEIPWGLWGGLVPLLVFGAGIYCVRGTIKQRKLNLNQPEEAYDDEDVDFEEEGYFNEDEVLESEEVPIEELEQLRRNPFRSRHYRDKVKTDIELMLLSGGLGCFLCFYLNFKTYADFINPFLGVCLLGLITGIVCIIKDMIKYRPKL